MKRIGSEEHGGHGQAKCKSTGVRICEVYRSVLLAVFSKRILSALAASLIAAANGETFAKTYPNRKEQQTFGDVGVCEDVISIQLTLFCVLHARVWDFACAPYVAVRY
jgi:hypothetical protein